LSEICLQETLSDSLQNLREKALAHQWENILKFRAKFTGKLENRCAIIARFSCKKIRLETLAGGYRDLKECQEGGGTEGRGLEGLEGMSGGGRYGGRGVYG